MGAQSPLLSGWVSDLTQREHSYYLLHCLHLSRRYLTPGKNKKEQFITFSWKRAASLKDCFLILPCVASPSIGMLAFANLTLRSIFLLASHKKPHYLKRVSHKYSAWKFHRSFVDLLNWKCSWVASVFRKLWAVWLQMTANPTELNAEHQVLHAASHCFPSTDRSPGECKGSNIQIVTFEE